MAATDARPIPIKNTAYRLYFVAFDSAGVRVTGFTAPDSEVSQDGGAVTDCTNEATFVGLGRGYIDLTLTEMNADHVGFSFTCTEGTADVDIYPQESGDILVQVQSVTAGAIVLAKGTGVTGFTDLSAAQVNAEVVDALATDTYAEPGQGAPATTLPLAAKINYLFKAWRNRVTQTSSAYSLYGDDAVTVDQKATVSDDGTTLVKGEVATGP